MLQLEDVEGVPFQIDPSATPWMFTLHGGGCHKLVTVTSHDGTELGHFFGPSADDNALFFSAMMRVCGGSDPEKLRQMRVTLRELIEGGLHTCSDCGHSMYGSLVKGPDNGDGTPKCPPP